MAGIAKIKQYVRKALAEEGDVRKIALGFAVGVYISFTPLLSLHTVLAIGVALLTGLNKVSAIAGAWVNNPYTIPFVYFYSYKLGAIVMGSSVPPPSFSNFKAQKIAIYLKAYGGPLFLGTTITGLLAAVISYFLMYYGVKAFRKRIEREGGNGEELKS